MNAELDKKIAEIICDILEVDEDELDPTIPFAENADVVWDSIKGLDILTAIEKEFQIRMDEKYLARMDTLENTINLVKEVVNQ